MSLEQMAGSQKRLDGNIKDFLKNQTKILFAEFQEKLEI
jgi:hypothetical protein